MIKQGKLVQFFEDGSSFKSNCLYDTSSKEISGIELIYQFPEGSHGKLIREFLTTDDCDEETPICPVCRSHIMFALLVDETEEEEWYCTNQKCEKRFDFGEKQFLTFPYSCSMIDFRK